MYIQTQIYKRAHTSPHPHMHTDANICTSAHSLTKTYVHTRSRTYPHASTHIYTRPQINTNANLHSNIHTCTHHCTYTVMTSGIPLLIKEKTLLHLCTILSIFTLYNLFQACKQIFYFNVVFMYFTQL